MSKKGNSKKQQKIRIVETSNGFAPAGEVPSKLVNNLMGRMKPRWDELHVLDNNIRTEILTHTESVQATIMTVENTRGLTGKAVVPDYNEFTVCCNAFWRDMQNYTNELLEIGKLYEGKQGEINTPDDTALSAMVYEKYQQLTVMLHSTITHMATNMTEYSLCAADELKDYYAAEAKGQAEAAQVAQEAINALEKVEAEKASTDQRPV